MYLTRWFRPPKKTRQCFTTVHVCRERAEGPFPEISPDQLKSSELFKSSACRSPKAQALPANERCGHDVMTPRVRLVTLRIEGRGRSGRRGDGGRQGLYCQLLSKAEFNRERAAAEMREGGSCDAAATSLTQRTLSRRCAHALVSLSIRSTYHPCDPRLRRDTPWYRRP